MVAYIRNHIWGIILGVFYSSLAGISFNMLQKSGFMEPYLNILKLAYEAHNIMGDILGTAGVILGIPSAIAYVFGLHSGKYRRKR